MSTLYFDIIFINVQKTLKLCFGGKMQNLLRNEPQNNNKRKNNSCYAVRISVSQVASDNRFFIEQMSSFKLFEF